jgi:hypothetical protein
MAELGAPADARMEVDESYANETRAVTSREGMEDRTMTQQDTEGAVASPVTCQQRYIRGF